MTIEAMKQALEALECIFASTHPYRGDDSTFTDKASTLGDKAITCLRQAIEQAEKQEPVAWMNDSTPAGIFARHKKGAENFGCTIPLYTTPQPQPCPYIRSTREGTHHCALSQRQWVGLTDEEIKPLCDENYIIYGAYAVDFIQSIEAKLKEKNT